MCSRDVQRVWNYEARPAPAGLLGSMARFSRFALLLLLLHAAQAQNGTKVSPSLHATYAVRFGYVLQDNFPYYMWSGHTGTRLKPTGFIPGVVEALARRLGVVAEHVPIPAADAVPTPLKLMAGSLMAREVDVILYALTPNLLNLSGVLVLVPYSTDRVRMLVRVDEAGFSLWNWLQPFKWGMWLGILVALACFSISLGLIIVLSSAKPRDSGWLGLFPTLVYHVGAALLGSDDYDYSTPPMKFMRLSVLFFSFMVCAT